MSRIILALVALGFSGGSAFAHYNMLLPDKPWANKDEKVTFTYQFGHPFENELFDAPEPRAVVVILPDGKTQKIDKFTKLSVPGADGKKVTAFSFVYEPAMRGDHTVILQTPPIWMEDSKGFVQDTVKVVLHVQAQKNWAALPPGLFEGKPHMIPLTRPYGLWANMIFQVEVIIPRAGRLGAGNLLVEVERYNSRPVKVPPPDEFVTFKTKTDARGVTTFAFPTSGWWSMTADCHQAFGKFKDGEMEGPLRERTTLWLHVDEKK
jgi:cobalt/nickel transport protein